MNRLLVPTMAVLALSGCSLVVEKMIEDLPEAADDGGVGAFCRTAQDCFDNPMTWTNCLQTCELSGDGRGHCVLGPAAPDGVVCGGSDGAEICVAGACVMRRCGDGFLDRNADPPEYCDDGNSNEDDFCRTCQTPCTNPAPPTTCLMSPTDPCTGGVGSCDSTSDPGFCIAPMGQADGTTCTLEDGTSPGVCQTGHCIPQHP